MAVLCKQILFKIKMTGGEKKGSDEKAVISAKLALSKIRLLAKYSTMHFV